MHMRGPDSVRLMIFADRHRNTAHPARSSLGQETVGRAGVVLGFTIDDAKIVGIEVIADPKGFAVSIWLASLTPDHRKKIGLVSPENDPDP